VAKPRKVAIAPQLGRNLDRRPRRRQELADGGQCLDRGQVSPMGSVLLLPESLGFRWRELLVLRQQSAVLTDL
jgi:hypothetical protein